MFIYGGLKECTGGTKHRINGTQAVKYSFKDRIVHCHYVDGTPTGHLPIGKGDRNIKEDLETFLANDYRGLYSFEFANGSCFANPSQIDIDAINVMKNSINQIRKLTI